MNLDSLKNKLFTATPIHSIVFVRIIFGLLILWECYDQIASDVAFESFVEPIFHFKHYGFGWVEPLPGKGMYWLFTFLAAMSILVVIGLFFRVAIALFTIGFTYAFLCDQTAYLNHFYMIILFSILMFFMPMNRYFSFDAYFNPRIKTEKAPFWSLFLLRSQMEIILVYAGLVKINYDWLILSQPLKFWLGNADVSELLHNLLIQDWVVASAAYGVVILHVIGAPLLLLKQTRIYVFIIYCCFHVMNDHVFQIGSFPWMTIAMTTLFFAPDWPKKIFKFFDKKDVKHPAEETSILRKKIIFSLVAVWVVSQAILPLRFLLYPGNVSWTAEGKNFAWRMKLNSMGGLTEFLVTDPKTQQKWRVHPLEYLTYSQDFDLHCNADMILQLAHHLHKVWQEKGYEDVQVNVHAICAMNLRRPYTFIDPSVDLAKVERNLKHKDWITKFDRDWR